METINKNMYILHRNILYIYNKQLIYGLKDHTENRHKQRKQQYLGNIDWPFSRTRFHSRHCLQMKSDSLSLSLTLIKENIMCFPVLSGSLLTREPTGRKWPRRRTSCQNTSGWGTCARKRSTRPPASSLDRYVTCRSSKWEAIKVSGEKHKM